MELQQEQFVDLCILLGCDYCDKIRGIGPKSAYKLIQEHGSIENILKKIDKKKNPPPEEWLFAEARRLFVTPEVTPADKVELKWEKPNEEELVKYMCEKKGFAEDRIRAGAKKLAKARQGTTQGRLDGFFKVLPSTPNGPSPKRKAEDAKKASNSAKKAKGGGGKWKR